MKTLVATILLSPLLLFARESEKFQLKQLEQFETGDWVALRFGFYRSYGDYSERGPKFILQKLPDNRVLLSRMDDARVDLPVAIRFLTPEDAENARSAVAKFHRTALSESSQHPQEYVHTAIELRVTKPDGTTIDAATKFDEHKKTLSEFDDFLNRLVVPVKRVKRSAANDPDAEAKEVSIREIEIENQNLRIELQKVKEQYTELQGIMEDL